MTMRTLIAAAMLLALSACDDGLKGRPCSVENGECQQHSVPVPGHQATD
jgi:predicted small lipoprotein YifL